LAILAIVFILKEIGGRGLLIILNINKRFYIQVENKEKEKRKVELCQIV
jgi:hypothetical protein